jgi:hypothetical protein
MKKLKNISLILLVLVLLVIGSSSIVVTNENEYSLIRQFGKVDHVVSSAGVTFKIPFVQSVDKLPKEILLYDLSSSDVITSDKKTMICDSYILWQINDPLKFAQTRITGFVCYRNIPCHQSCFYAADLCRQKPYEPKYKIRADYEHFLWCYYRAKAPMQYLGLTVSSYEGGGYSETKENLKRSAAEHKEITAKYMKPVELFRYRAVMALTLAPLRTAMAESRHFSAIYQGLASKVYGRRQEK